MDAKTVRTMNGNIKLAWLIAEHHVTQDDVAGFTTEELELIYPIATDRHLARAIEEELKTRKHD